MSEEVIHVAGEPGKLRGSTRIIQPCTRCAFVLAEYDTANPPQVELRADGEPEKFHWWLAGARIGVRDLALTMHRTKEDGSILLPWQRECDPAIEGRPFGWVQ